MNDNALADFTVEINGHTSEKRGIVSDLNMVSDIGMGVYFAIVTNYDVPIDIAERANIGIFPNFSSWVDKYRFFNPHFIQPQLVVDFKQCRKGGIGILYPNKCS